MLQSQKLPKYIQTRNTITVLPVKFKTDTIVTLLLIQVIGLSKQVIHFK